MSLSKNKGTSKKLSPNQCKQYNTAKLTELIENTKSEFEKAILDGILVSFELSTEEGKVTPRYTRTEMVGDYPALEVLCTTDKQTKEKVLRIYLKPIHTTNKDAPAMQLLATKNSINITGIKFYEIEGMQTRYAYGYPDSKEILNRQKPIPNPLYDCRDDGFLIIFSELNPIPRKIELLIIRGGKAMISQTCSTLAKGGLNDALERLRQEPHKKCYPLYSKSLFLQDFGNIVGENNNV